MCTGTLRSTPTKVVRLELGVSFDLKEDQHMLTYWIEFIKFIERIAPWDGASNAGGGPIDKIYDPASGMWWWKAF